MTARPPRFATLILLTAFATLSLTMFLPSLQAISEDFRADYALVNLAIAGYLGVTAVLQLVIGPLSDRYGRRPVLLVCLGLFTAASIGCLLAQDIVTFLAFRMIQGVVIAGASLSAAIVRDTHPPESAASRIGYISMAMAVAPITGPMLGGVLEEAFGWRATFVFYAVAGGLLLLWVWADLGETNHRRSATLRAQIRTYPQLLGAGRFWGYALCSALSVSAFYAFLSGVPILAEPVLGISPAMLGLCLGSITGGYAFGSYIAGRTAGRFPLTFSMLAGRLIAVLGLSVGFALIAAGVIAPIWVFAATVFIGNGNGISMPASSSGAMSVRPDLAGSAAGLSGSMVVGAGALVTSAVGAALSALPEVLLLLGIMLGLAVAALAVAALTWRVEKAGGV